LLMNSKDSGLVDLHGRSINYLRLSVTDRCNLRCMYCQIREDFSFIPHSDILTYEECLELIRLSQHIGVSKVRLTGGEPFVRKDFEGFLGRILSAWPDLDLRVTTNGTLITDKIERLKDMGLKSLNISLDTLQRSKYAEITGKDLFPQVQAALDKALEHGLSIKLNVVAMRGVNDDELADFIDYATGHPVDVRFIECMPVGESLHVSRQSFWSADDILRQAQELNDLEPVLDRHLTGGPARMFNLAGGKGRIGVISPLSHHFCSQCNRLRITSDGRLRPCLFSEREYRLKPLLRSTRLGEKHILRVLRQAGQKKPLGHTLLQDRCRDEAEVKEYRRMSSLGG